MAKLNKVEFETRKSALLNKLVNHEITIEQYTQQESILQAHRDEKELTPKVSQKGACSVYGLQRMPVTLYPNQWIRLFENASIVLEFIKANAGKFSVKSTTATADTPTEEDVDAALEAVS